MAMQLNPGSDVDDADAPIMDINTTPLIDVMLVLLVMLIITIPVQLHAVNLNLPVKPPLVPPAPPVVVRVDIDASNAVYWNGLRLADRAALETQMQAAAAQSPQPEVHLRPDAHSRYQALAEVLVSANRIGLTRLGVLGNDAVAGR